MDPNLPEDPRIRWLLKAIRVRDIMMFPVYTVTLDTELSRVAELFIRHRTSHICVLENSGELVGLVSQKYLYKARSPRKIIPGHQIGNDKNLLVDGDTFFDRKALDAFLLSSIMDANVTTISEGDSIASAVKTMARMHNDCLVVVDTKRKVQGILRESHIINLLAQYID